MRSKYVQSIQYILLLAAGILLAWLFFRTMDTGQLMHELEHGDLSWFLVVMLVSLSVYIIRVLRWQMLIKASGYKAGFMNAFSALSIGYFVNFAVPRLGELTRCLSLKKSENIPFMQLLGTVIVERVVDILSLALLLLLTLALQFDKITVFAKENVFEPIYQGIILKILAGNTFVLVMTVLVTCVFLFFFFYFRKYIRERSPALLLKFIQGLKDGLTSVLKLERKWLFIFYTVLIWFCYYLMTWFWFYVFEQDPGLGWGACLAIVAIGSVGRSVPIQGGGMGAYHFLVTSVAVIYGTTEAFGKTLATLIHAGQTFFTFAMGLVGLLIFFILYWKRR